MAWLASFCCATHRFLALYVATIASTSDPIFAVDWAVPSISASVRIQAREACVVRESIHKGTAVCFVAAVALHERRQTKAQSRALSPPSPTSFTIQSLCTLLLRSSSGVREGVGV